MTVSDFVNFGDKIDIQLTYQIQQQQNGQAVEVNTYKSMVMDFPTDHQIEIGMPTFGGKMILFQIGIRCNMVFYTKKGLYQCECTVSKRYKKENFFLLLMEVNTPMTKYQRREYFRVDCNIDMNYHRVSAEVAKLPTTAALYAELQGEEYAGTMRSALIKDISGGGMRFWTDIPLEKGEHLISTVRLTNEVVDETFYLVTEVISCNRTDSTTEKYDIRGKFIFKDIKDRETIVRFVFDEERKIRRTRNG